MNTPNFSDIYTLYFEDVYKYLLALCHDEELAEELAQDTFFKAMKSYENFRHGRYCRLCNGVFDHGSHCWLVPFAGKAAAGTTG